MTATVAEIRNWARENGHDIASKGRIPPAIQTAYDDAHPGTEPGHPDYPDDDFESAFADMPDDAPETAETPPRKPRARAKAKTGVRGLFTRGTKPKASAKKKPRISTEDLLGGMWRGMAKLATPLPPLQRTLRVQAPVAGLLLDDAVRDTIVDPFLQPLARLASQGKAVQALCGPPMFVTAIMVHQAQRAQQGQEPHPIFMAMAGEGLRSSLMAWMDVAGPKFELALAREKEFEEKYGQSVDDMMKFIFAPPVDPRDIDAVLAEEEAIKRAQGIL